MSHLEKLLKQRSVRDGMEELFQRDEAAESRERFARVDLREVDRAAMQRLIVLQLGELPGCTIDDVDDAWRFALAGGHSDFASAYEQFCEYLVASMGYHWRSEPLALTPESDFIVQHYPDIEVLWKSDDDEYEATILGAFPVGKRLPAGQTSPDTPAHSERLFISVSGTCSERFFHCLCDRVITTLSCILDGLLKLNSRWLERALGEQREDTQELFLKNFLNGQTLFDASGNASVEEEDGWLVECPNLLLLRKCLDALFADVPGKKASWQRRIKNGVRLIVEGMKQSENAVGLALFVSAIEAMLVDQSEGIAAIFAERMAVLLEPDLQFRSDAEQWCRNCYSLRSKVLHGTAMEASGDEMSETQMASVAVLKAIVECRDGFRRYQAKDIKPHEFFEELKKGKYNVGEPMFVPETPLNVLWRRSLNMEGDNRP